MAIPVAIPVGLVLYHENIANALWIAAAIATDAYEAGFEEGSDHAWDAGYTEGREEGYDDGYGDALRDALG